MKQKKIIRRIIIITSIIAMILIIFLKQKFAIDFNSICSFVFVVSAMADLTIVVLAKKFDLDSKFDTYYELQSAFSFRTTTIVKLLILFMMLNSLQNDGSSFQAKAEIISCGYAGLVTLLWLNFRFSLEKRGLGNGKSTD